MTQEMVVAEQDAHYEEVRAYLRSHLAAQLQGLIDLLDSMRAEGYITAQHALVYVNACRELGKLYRVQGSPDEGRMVPFDEVQARIEAAVEEALRVEVPAAVAQARMLWEQEKQILEEGMRQRALDRVRTQG